MSDKSRAAWPEAIADDDASLLWFVAKSSFLLKEPQEAPRESQSVQRIFTPERRCNCPIPSAHKSPAREAQIVQLPIHSAVRRRK